MDNDKTYSSAVFFLIIFCNVKSCSTLDIYRSFEGMDYIIL
jgi:hypothetical protein